jgi:hypothetical protein
MSWLTILKSDGEEFVAIWFVFVPIPQSALSYPSASAEIKYG